MENAVDALKIGFAVLVFAMALSLAMYMFTQARETADVVLHSSDITKYMEYIEPEEGIGKRVAGSRIIGLEAIIPTLYRYYKENYMIIFAKDSGEASLINFQSFEPLYRSKTNPELWSSNPMASKNDSIIYCFDVDGETSRHEPWTGNSAENKKMIDTFIRGGIYSYTDSRGQQNVDFGRGILNKYKGKKFYERFYDNVKITSSSSENNLEGKRVIIYSVI